MTHRQWLKHLENIFDLSNILQMSSALTIFNGKIFLLSFPFLDLTGVLGF
jgi:hypothetical protein